MSQYVYKSQLDPNTKWVYGWDQPLQSFFLQKHDLTKPEDEQIVAWLGATNTTKMYEVEDLVREARVLGLDILHGAQTQLYADKDEGR